MKNTGYLCFLIVLKMLGVKCENTEFEMRFEKQGNVDFEIIRTAKELGLKVKTTRYKKKIIEKLSVPVIAKCQDENYILILSDTADKWMILNPKKGQPENVTEDKLLSLINGDIIVLGKKASGINEGLDNGGKRFGFSWFIPTILKYKRQFVSVLIAVFVIQILGILTPLMTQVVVDKVLTHRAMNTLYTIGIGIFLVYVYELIISLCKSYLFVHTTNRIDVTLSSRLFKHLFSLPLKYFESRRVGETVARVRELDQIRSFLTGTPLSSIIDVVFIVVYIVVMFFYSTSLTVVVIASMPVFALLSIIVTPLFKKSLDKKFETGAKAQSFLVESINGIQTVKSFALEESFEEKWGGLFDGVAKYNINYNEITLELVESYIQVNESISDVAANDTDSLMGISEDEVTVNKIATTISSALIEDEDTGNISSGSADSVDTMVDSMTNLVVQEMSEISNDNVINVIDNSTTINNDNNVQLWIAK